MTDSSAAGQPLRFVRRGAVVTLPDVPADRTLLEVLREDLHCHAVKEGCNEGDCGACTVVVGEVAQGRLRYRAVNACIRLAHSVDGLALWTAADLRDDDGGLHPAQQALVQCHGSQCGFCTPGFVMSLYSMYQNHVRQGRPITRALAQHDLSGNLCRCTGYRPILDAAQAMADLPMPDSDEADTLLKLEQLSQHPRGLQADLAYQAPPTLKQLLDLRAADPQAQLVAGCTDVGLWINKGHRSLPRVLDVTRVAELRRIERYPHHVAIGAAVTLADAWDALVADRPQLAGFAARFAGLPVRQSGTLGGNVANGSPIGDGMPVLIALGAHLVLMSRRGHREMPLERYYTGYRSNLLAPDEVLAWIKVPLPTADEFSRAYKVSRRFDDDISAVCLALSLRLQDGRVQAASIGVGGVAATPVRAPRTEAALRGQVWDGSSLALAERTLRAEFTPISDLRASASYRQRVLGGLLRRFWLATQGETRLELSESGALETAP